MATIGSSVDANNTAGAHAIYNDVAAAVDAQSGGGTATLQIICMTASMQATAKTISVNGTFLLTADSATYVNAYTHAACSSRARITNALTLAATGWIFEKFGCDNGANNGIITQETSTLRRLVIVNSGTYGIRAMGTAKTHTLSNIAIIYTGGTVGIGMDSGTSTTNAYHVSMLSPSAFTGYYVEPNQTLNCYACYGKGVATATWGGGGTKGGDNNASSDLTAPGTTKWRSQSNVFTLETAASENLTLAPWAQNRYGAADYTASAGGDPATDIAGTTRAAPFNAGCSQHTTDLSSTLLTGLVACYEYQEAANAARHNWYETGTTDDGLLTDHNTVAQGTGHVSAFCGDFTTVNSEWNDKASATKRIGNADFSVELWVYLKDKSASVAYQILNNISTAGKVDYGVFYDVGSDRFYIRADDTGGIHQFALNTFGSPSATTWYQIIVKYDSAGKILYGRVNNGAWDSHSSGVAKAANADGLFEVGRQSSGAQYYANMLYAPVRLWNVQLADQDCTDLNNGSGGLAFPLTRPAAPSTNTTRGFFALCG